MSAIPSRIIRLADDDDEPAATPAPRGNVWLQTPADSEGEVVRAAPPVRRLRPDTKPGKLRGLNVGDAYLHRATAAMPFDERHNQASAWRRAAQSIGIVVQIVTDDDGVLWIYRRK